MPACVPSLKCRGESRGPEFLINSDQVCMQVQLITCRTDAADAMCYQVMCRPGVPAVDYPIHLIQHVSEVTYCALACVPAFLDESVFLQGIADALKLDHVYVVSTDRTTQQLPAPIYQLLRPATFTR